MMRRKPSTAERMTPLDVLAVRRFRRAEYPNRLARLAVELGFRSVAAMEARADEVYANPRQGRPVPTRRPIEDADVEDDVYLRLLDR